MARPHKQIGPTVPQSVGGPAPSKPEDGGRRRGKALKRAPKTSKRGYVTRDNLITAREHGGKLVVTPKGSYVSYRREV